MTGPSLMEKQPKQFENARYRKGTWYRLPDGTEFGIRQSEDHGLTMDVDSPSLPRGYKVHQR